MAGTERVKQCHEGMVLVRGGTFEMGSANGNSNERSVRSVRITTLCVDEHGFANEGKGKITLLTANEFEAVPIACGSGAFQTPLAGRYETAKEAWDANVAKVDHKNICGLYPRPLEAMELPQSPSGFDGPRQPLMRVKWKQADAICKAQGKRLLTEAEWEYVARGESHQQEYATRDGKKPTYKQARFGEGPTADVCSYRGNYVTWEGEEICDLAINTLEWVSDWYQDSYAGLGNVNPTGSLMETGRKVLRGGFWYSKGVDGRRASNRDWGNLGYTSDVTGFRCASSPERL